MNMLEFFQHIAYCLEFEYLFYSEKSFQESQEFFETEFEHFGECVGLICAYNKCLQKDLKIEAEEMLEAYNYFVKGIKK